MPCFIQRHFNHRLNKMKQLIQCLLIIVFSAAASGQETSTVQYLANEGLMSQEEITNATLAIFKLY